MSTGDGAEPMEGQEASEAQDGSVHVHCAIVIWNTRVNLFTLERMGLIEGFPVPQSLSFE